MTRYSPIIGYVLAWQLLMPVLYFFAGQSWWIAFVTAIVFIILSVSKDWEKNSYSAYAAVAVVAFSLMTAMASCLEIAQSIASAIWVIWLYALIAYTATSPYPLSIRMPLIIYSLAYVFMVPKGTPTPAIIAAALTFASVMCLIAVKWKRKSCGLTTAHGPAEPSYSFSLATAIVAAVAINLGLTISEYFIQSNIPNIISITLLTAICCWLLCAKDWQKNSLAVTALALMITLHMATGLGYEINGKVIHTAIYILSVTPVMFHTTAPVFRGMRIVITLYAVYNALNRHTLISWLEESALPIWQQHSIMIGIDALLALTLFVMALHWRRNG